jgi:hypothetical protein
MTTKNLMMTKCLMMSRFLRCLMPVNAMNTVSSRFFSPLYSPLFFILFFYSFIVIQFLSLRLGPKKGASLFFLLGPCEYDPSDVQRQLELMTSSLCQRCVIQTCTKKSVKHCDKLADKASFTLSKRGDLVRI